MNATGDAITLVSPEEDKDARAIEKFLGRRIPHETISGFDYHAHAKKTAHGDSERHGRSHAEHGGGRGSHGATHRSSGREPAGAAPRTKPSEPPHGRRRKVNATDRRSRRRM
jgi:ATP-dependent RNA helicase RhlE